MSNALSMLLAVAFMVCCHAMSAQRSNVPVAPVPRHLEDLSANAPAEMRSLIKAIAGKWSITEKFEPNEASPNGGVGDGEEVWRSGPGGFTLMEEERNRAPFGEVFLFALMWWDKSTNSFRGLLCNNSGPAACNVESFYNSSLKWNGIQLVIDMEFPQKGKKMTWHEVFFDITPTSFTQTGNMGEAGGLLQRWVTIHATRIAEGTKGSSD